uniref:NADH-ubiquinone oxidoreductase chain 4 n=1 Tax=Norvellina sp. EMHAU-15062816 TaxID=2040462 RepID=A0A343KGM0_9HEMI|nr:NADH dehydrogenase subunit 4 [Norvellina sp. EMHAU-15062816]
MMKLIFTILFLTLLCFSFYFMLMQYSFLLMYLHLMFSGCNNYFSKISYDYGLDNFSWSLIMLSFLVSSFMLMSMISYSGLGMFMFMNMFLSLFLMVIFSSLNFLYMYISFEFVLVPLMILILGWGYQPERLIAGLYLFFYTVLVSLPLLFLLLYMYYNYGSLFFDYMNNYSNFFFIHFIITMVFMVKLPMSFVHFWLPKAHVQAPVSGSMILAGLMLKIGGYGLIRSSFLYEYLYLNYSYVWFSLSMVGSALISLICLIQADMKCLIAYSSICHMGLVIMGLVTTNSWGLMGSLLLMLGHGFCSSGLFYLANLLYMRTGSRSFYINKGLMLFLPSFSLVMFMFCIFNMSCPPSINFVSEMMILSSVMSYWGGSILFFTFISFLCACFSYYMYSYSQHGLNHNLYSFSMVNVQEFLCSLMHLIPLIFLVVVVKSLF